MNRVEIIGRLTRDVEVRYGAQSQTAVGKFTVAVDVGYGEKKKTSFIPVVTFGKTAENCERYLAKGRQVAVEGYLQSGSYEKDGAKVYTMDVIAERVEFIGGGKAEQKAPEPEEPSQMGFDAIDGDIPF